MTDYVKREDVMRLIREESSAWEGKGDDVAGAHNALECVADSVRSIPEAPVSEEREEIARECDEWVGNSDVAERIKTTLANAASLLRSTDASPVSEEREEKLEAENARLRAGLRFYAHGHHWECEGAASGQWDTVSGEPQNWYYRENDTDDAEGIEDGTIAKRILLGQEIDWEDKEPKPLDGEAARLLRAPQQQAEPVAYGIRTVSDGSWDTNIAPTGYRTFTALREAMERDPWVKVGKSTIAPLYAAPPPDDEAVRFLFSAIELVTWDSDGAIAPVNPAFSWESVARMSLDYVSAYLSRKEPKG